MQHVPGQAEWQQAPYRTCSSQASPVPTSNPCGLENVKKNKKHLTFLNQANSCFIAQT